MAGSSRGVLFLRRLCFKNNLLPTRGLDHRAFEYMRPGEGVDLAFLVIFFLLRLIS